MSIYKTSIRGVDTPRLVRAGTAAKARDHLVSTESVSAEELADLIEAGATIETAVDKPVEKPTLPLEQAAPQPEAAAKK